MSILRWKHGKTAAEARDLMQGKLREAGYDDQVKWAGNDFSASVGWGSVLSVKGSVSEHEAVLDKCGGAMGGTVLAKVQEILQELFPGGKVA